MLTLKVKMGNHRFTKVIENALIASKMGNDLKLSNAISAIKLLEKPGGWSNAFGFKNSLPAAISPKPYQTGELHCCWSGVYDSPATIDNIAANIIWSDINSDINYRRLAAVGYVDVVEIFAAPTIGILANKVKTLLLDILQEFGSLDRLTGNWFKFYICAHYDDKDALIHALQEVNTKWETLSEQQKEAAQLYFFTSETEWDTNRDNLYKIIISDLCFGDPDNLIYNKLVESTP